MEDKEMYVRHMKEPDECELAEANRKMAELSKEVEEWESYSDEERLAYMLMKRFGSTDMMDVWYREEIETPPGDVWGARYHSSYLSEAKEILKLVKFEVIVDIFKIICDV